MSAIGLGDAANGRAKLLRPCHADSRLTAWPHARPELLANRTGAHDPWEAVTSNPRFATAHLGPRAT